MPRGRIAGLDGLRAVAALYVLAYHASVFAVPSSTWLREFANMGWSGVDVFFTISGFILALPFMRKAWTGERVNIRRYGIQRVRRILPAYWLNLLVLAVFTSSGLLTTWRGWKALFTNVTYTAGYFRQPQVNGVYWTLFCEMAFYLALPFIAVIFRRRWFVIAAPALLVTVFAYKTWLIHTFLTSAGQLSAAQHPHMESALEQFPSVLDEFAIGMTLAAVSAWIEHRGIEVPSWSAWLATLLGVGGFIAVLVILEHPLGSTAYWFGTSALGFIPLVVFKPLLALCSAIVIFGICHRTTWVTRLLDIRPVRYLGILSYGIYLWHLPVVERLAPQFPKDWGGNHRYAATLVLAGLIAVVLAEISFRFVESRFLGESALRLRGISVRPHSSPESAHAGTTQVEPVGSSRPEIPAPVVPVAEPS